MAERAPSQDLDARAVSFIAAGILASLICAVVILALAYARTISKPVIAPQRFPQPAVRTSERAERLQLERAQKAHLAGPSGSMTIEQAMRMIVERGAKAYDPVPGGAP